MQLQTPYFQGFWGLGFGQILDSYLKGDKGSWLIIGVEGFSGWRQILSYWVSLVRLGESQRQVRSHSGWRARTLIYSTLE